MKQSQSLTIIIEGRAARQAAPSSARNEDFLDARVSAKEEPVYLI